MKGCVGIWGGSGLGGYRCGVTENLGGESADNWERIIYMASPTLILTPIPTLNEWGLIAMAGIMGIVGIVGFMVIRRRKADA